MEAVGLTLPQSKLVASTATHASTRTRCESGVGTLWGAMVLAFLAASCGHEAVAPNSDQEEVREPDMPRCRRQTRVQLRTRSPLVRLRQDRDRVRRGSDVAFAQSFQDFLRRRRGRSLLGGRGRPPGSPPREQAA